MKLNFFTTLIMSFSSFLFFNFAHSSPANTTKELQEACHENKGILILAHGNSNHDHGDPASNPHRHRPPHSDLNNDMLNLTTSFNEWDNTILEMVGEASPQIPYPLEVAFGMWDQKSFQEGVNILASESICELVIVPLFVSDHSEVIRAQKYQFHISEENPLPFDPGRVKIPSTIQNVVFKTALNDHPYLSEIISNRAQAISQKPEQENLILVAHGPNGDEDDALWIQDLSTHASKIKGSFHKIDVLTLRDDAPDEIRNRKTKELQDLVKKALEDNRKALIVPVLLAPGGIEKGLKERLQGLEYTISHKMLAPDSLLIDWIVQESLSIGLAQ